MRTLPLIACALLFALPAKADKFWLTDPDAAKNAAPGSSPEFVAGVLLAEDGDAYHIRVVGGELILAKKSVFKIEKDGLSLDAIVKAEKDGAEALALRNRERLLKQQIAKKEREVQVAEASAKKGAAKPAAQASAKGEAAAAGFDPVVGRAVPATGDPLREAQLAYEASGDRANLRALRQLRRLR